MEIQDLATISIEGCASILLLVFAYKVYRAKIDTAAESKCCKWLDLKVTTHNAGHNEQPSLMSQV